MSNLADVRDIDCVVSFVPLVFDLGSKEVSGAYAVLRRILYRWCTPKGALRYASNVGLTRALTDLEAATMSPSQLDGLRIALLREAMEEDFVDDVRLSVTLTDAGLLSIVARVRLVDGKEYPLEVSAGQASAALLSIGGTS